MFLELLTRCCQGLIDPLNYVAQMTASYMDIQNVTTKGLQTTIRSMERTFQVAGQCLQPGSEQLSFDDTLRKFGPKTHKERADIGPAAGIMSVQCEPTTVYPGGYFLDKHHNYRLTQPRGQW